MIWWRQVVVGLDGGGGEGRKEVDGVCWMDYLRTNAMEFV